MTNWLLLIACGALFGTGIIFLRAGCRRRTTTWGLALYVGLLPCLVSAALAVRHLHLFSPAYAALEVLAGIFGIAAIWASTEALRRGPTGPTFLILSYGIVVPVLASVLFYGEPLGWLRVVGLAIVAVSIPCLQGPRREAGAPAAARHPSAAWMAYAAASFLLYGAASVLLRDAVHRNASGHFYLGVVLLAYVGNLVGSGLGLAISGQRPTRADAWWGTATGMLNFAAFIITLFVMRNMGGVLLFPARLVISVGVVVLLAIVVFKERPSLRTAVGLALGTAGIVLVAIKPG